jgi:hypothetical protein
VFREAFPEVSQAAFRAVFPGAFQAGSVSSADWAYRGWAARRKQPAAECILRNC